MKKKTLLKATPSFENELDKIEDFVFNQRSELKDVSKFLDQLEHLTEFIRNNPLTPSVYKKTGDRSWITSDKNYRVFFRVVESEANLIVYLTDIDACRAANLDRFPEHRINEEDSFTTDE